MYCARARRRSRSAADGRARVGPRSGVDRQDRRPYLRFEIAVHYCDCDPQHAAGSPRRREDGILPERPAGRVRRNSQDIHEPQRQADRRLHHWEVRIMRKRFQQSLDDLKENLLVMAGLAEQAIQRAIEAYRVRDLSICDLVSRSEVAINRMERDIDQAALDLLAMEQPTAIDLRFILSVIKINADLERVGDAAKSISERVRNMEQMGSVEFPVDIPRMASLSADMVRKSLQSFIEADAETARNVLTMDDAVDAMNRAAYKALTKVMEEQSHLAPQALNALMICRSLERVADHATNIAEDVIFWVQGADVRHYNSVNAAKQQAQKVAEKAPPATTAG